MINFNVQITYVLVSFNVWKLTWKNSCKSQNTLWPVENGTTTTSFASYCIASWVSFVSNLWYFYEIATPIRTETLVFHIFKLFHNTYFLSTPYIWTYNKHRVLILFLKLNIVITALYSYKFYYFTIIYLFITFEQLKKLQRKIYNLALLDSQIALIVYFVWLQKFPSHFWFIFLFITPNAYFFHK